MSATIMDGEATMRDRIRLLYTRHTAPIGAPRIVFVHSLALSQTLWSRVTAMLDGHAEMITYDCRGHGRSGRTPGPYTVGQFADDLAELLDHVGWTDAVVAGCSMGGCVAQNFAARYPGHTQAALFVDTTAWYGPSAPIDWAERAATAREKGLEALVPFQLARWFSPEFQEAEPRLMKRLAGVFTANDLDAYQATCTMLGMADLRAGARSIRQPAAVLVGEHDEATPPAMAQDLADRIGCGPALVVPGARHLTPLENPNAVAYALSELIKQIPMAGASY
jgi:3-oxoadipate enol-lactonase